MWQYSSISVQYGHMQQYRSIAQRCARMSVQAMVRMRGEAAGQYSSTPRWLGGRDGFMHMQSGGVATAFAATPSWDG